MKSLIATFCLMLISLTAAADTPTKSIVTADSPETIAAELVKLPASCLSSLIDNRVHQANLAIGSHLTTLTIESVPYVEDHPSPAGGWSVHGTETRGSAFYYATQQTIRFGCRVAKPL